MTSSRQVVHRFESITVKTFEEFEAAINACVRGKATDIQSYPVLTDNTAVFIYLAGQFIGRDEPNWGLIEEAQMLTRLDGWPLNVFATLRGSGTLIYCDLLRLH